jgi:hypothetical protein
VPQPARIGARVLWDYRELVAWNSAGMPAREIWEVRWQSAQNGQR